MAAGDKPRRRSRFDSRELARLSGKVNPTTEAWDERVALPQASDRLPVSRTATLDDPLTTSLLAEVARRTRTVEIAPDPPAPIDEVAASAPDTAEPGEGEPADEPR